MSTGLAHIQVKEKCGDSATEGFEESTGLDQVLQILQGVSFPRDPGTPKLRMVLWNLNTMRFGGDWTPQSSAENLTEFLRDGGCFLFLLAKGNYYNTRWWFQIFVIFNPIPGKMMQFDEDIFQTG